MANDIDPLLLRVHIAASLGSKSPSDIINSEGTLALGVTGDATSTANALAEALGGEAAVPNQVRFHVQDWLEWEERVLRPATQATTQSALLQEALAQLETTVKGGHMFLGHTLTLADIAIFSTLHSIPATTQLPEGVRQYIARLGEESHVKEGLQTAASSRQASSKQAGPSSAPPPTQPPLRPIKGQRNLLITSALPYVNNVPHLGNLIGAVLSADCYARYARSRGYNALYICGTDEYGTATEAKALAEGLTCQEICDKYNALHKEIYDWFDISFDKFGRTPTWQQTEIGQGMFKRLQEQGFILEDTMEQLYSEALGKFLADRFVSGTCPKCKFEDAKGDQCDNCGTMLNPTELINPRCQQTGTTPVLRTTRHLFLDLPKLADELQSYIDTTSDLGGWSSNCLSLTKAWMRDGLKPRCITRDLQWGTPVPFEGYEDKVFYVWFDAPIGYISITANYTDNWKEWWQNPEEVDLVQFMGKDNVPFHTIIFPASQIGTRERWTQMKNISVTEYLNYEGEKFSKSNGVGVFGDNARETGIPVEVWRFYLLSVRPEVSDSDFQWSDIRAKYNNELIANLGNFVNRTLSFTASKFGGVVPPAVLEGSSLAGEVRQLGADVRELVGEYVANMEKIRLRDGIRIAMLVSSLGNKFLQEKRPWELLREEATLADAGTVINVCLGIALLLAGLIEPFIPNISTKILEQLGLPPGTAKLSDAFLEGAAHPWRLVPAGHKIGPTAVLFQPITPELAEELKARFEGTKTDGKSAKVKKQHPARASAGTKAEKGKLGLGNGKTANGAVGEKQAQTKEKKSKAPTAKVVAPTDLSGVDLRVGVITTARKHENAESLYVESIECGEEKERQVVSGLVKHIALEDMQGRRVVIVANLKAGNMRGVRSEAMVLAASSADGQKVELVEPPEGAVPGERVTAAGFEGDPVAVLKKEAFDPIASGLKTNADLVACYQDLPLLTSKGLCTVQSISHGAIR